MFGKASYLSAVQKTGTLVFSTIPTKLKESIRRIAIQDTKLR